MDVTLDDEECTPCRTPATVAAALSDRGFCYLTLSKAEQRATGQLFAAAARFHSSDDAWKALARHRPTRRGGYYKAGEEPTYYASEDDASDAVASRVEDYSVVSTGDDQVWPEGEIGDVLRDAALQYLDVADAAGTVVRDALGSLLASDERPAKRRRRTAEPLVAAPSMLRLLRYPAAGGDLSAHSDFECFTFVHQRVAGLEVLVDGAWKRLAAAPDDSHCVLLAGDAAEFLSGGAVRAARHRVRSGAPRRESIVLFHAAADDAPLEPRVGDRSAYDAARRAADAHFGSAAPLTQRRHVRCRVERAEKHEVVVE